MTEPRTRLLAAAATAVGLIAAGFEAHLAPQADGWWHGLTGSPSLLRVTIALVAAFLVWGLGRDVNVRPFLGMGVGLLPFVPAITGFGAPLLFFSGYTMGLLFAILLGGTARDLLAKLPATGPFSVVMISFAFFLLVGRALPGPAGPQGDEPHYLLIAESLLKDGDVDLLNQFEQRAFSKFTSANLEPHTAPRSPQGKLYAIHTPGLSALIAPGYTLLGFAGARAVVSFAMAMVVGLLFFVSRSRFGAPTASLVFVLATFASPLPIYANSLFPDSVSTLPVAATLACAVSTHPALLGLASASIAILPWLHPRFLPLALILALFLAVRGGFSLRRAASAFVPLFVSLGLLLFYFQALFGRASLSAAYGPGFSSDVSLTHIPWGASALILDRQFGLLLFSPFLLVGLPGAASLWKRDRMMTVLVIAVAFVLLGVGGSFSMWWGGASAPARFLIGAAPALMVLGGAGWKDAEARPDRRALLGAAIGFGLGLLCLASLAPRALHNRSDGESGLLRLLAPVLDIDGFFPGFVSGDSLWIAGFWVVVLVTTMIRPRLGLWVVALPVAFALVVFPTPILDPFASSLRILEAWGNRRQAFGGRDVETAFALEVPLGTVSWDLTPGVLSYSPRFSLPKGAWTLRVESRAENTPGALNLSRIGLVGEDEQAASPATVMIRAGENVAVAEFDLGQGERRLHIRGEGLQGRARILSVRLIPRAAAR